MAKEIVLATLETSGGRDNELSTKKPPSVVSTQVKKMKVLITVSLLLLSSSCSFPAQVRKTSLRPGELLETPNTYLNQPVEVEIVEPLYGPTNAEQLARAEYGQVEVRIPEGLNGRISLVPQAFKVSDPNRYRQKFDHVIEPPVKVRGEFLKDEEMSNAEHKGIFVIRVTSIEPLVLGQPEKVGSLKKIESDPTRWDRKLITYEGLYQKGFEVSSLDGKIWVETFPTATIIKPNSTADTQLNKVRVVGILFSKPGAHYGHLGGSRFQLVATKIEYLNSVVK